MDVIAQIIEVLRTLPEDRQREVLNFVEFLQAKSLPQGERPTFLGLWADLGVHLSKEDIDEARREMWSPHPTD